jgi:lysophospholipase L1-like esterase
MEPAPQPKPTTEALPSRRRRGRRLVFVIVLLAPLLAGQEVLFRAIFPLPEVYGFNRVRYQMLSKDSPTYQETIRRGFVYDRLLFRSEPDGFSEIHRLNRYGFRGPDFTIDPTRGRRRILVIGDSVTEGQGAPESGTITAELDRLLARDGVSAEVINLGVIAATLLHLTDLTRDAIPLLRPTDVVLVLYANDLPAPPYPTYLRQPPTSFPRRDDPWWTPRVIELIRCALRNEPIYRRWPPHPAVSFFPAVPDPTNPWTGKPGPPPGLDPAIYRAMVTGTINPWLKEQSEGIPGMLSHDFEEGGRPTVYLEHIQMWCRSIGANLVVAYVPFCGVTHPRYAATLVKLGMDRTTAEALASDPVYRRQNAMLAELCPRLGLPLADATEALIRAEASEGPQFWSFDTHPRPAGYATIARRIHEALKR